MCATPLTKCLTFDSRSEYINVGSSNTSTQVLSVDGDPPAAMRYTEVKLHHIAKFLLDDLQENSVDFRPNYDNSEEEPVLTFLVAC